MSQQEAPAPGVVVVVALAGDLDMDAVDDVCARTATALNKPGVISLVLDMAEVTFVDSSGIGCLVDIRQLASTRGAELQLENVPSRIRRLLEITGVDGYLGA